MMYSLKFGKSADINKKISKVSSKTSKLFRKRSNLFEETMHRLGRNHCILLMEDFSERRIFGDNENKIIFLSKKFGYIKKTSHPEIWTLTDLQVKLRMCKFS